jgi:hypothetical protein
MSMQRTGGMTTIGNQNIVFGAIGALLSLLAVLGGGFLAAMGTAAESSGDAEGMGTAVAAGGGLIMIIGVVALACWAMMMFAGIGVLKMAPWGRTLSMVCGGALVLLNLYSLVSSGFGIMSVMFLLYGGMLVGMFCQPEWKNAFSGQPSSGIPGDATQSSDQMRRAA